MKKILILLSFVFVLGCGRDYEQQALTGTVYSCEPAKYNVTLLLEDGSLVTLVYNTEIKIDEKVTVYRVSDSFHKTSATYIHPRFIPEDATVDYKE